MTLSKTRSLVFTALCIALGLALPFAFHSIPNGGLIFLPMHIPVLMCGLIINEKYGLICGAITPILSSLLTGMPPAVMLPQMIVELSVYGLVTGLLFKLLTIKNIALKTYISLIGAMVAGRLVYGVLNALVFRAGKYSLEMWLSAAFITSVPGIMLQLLILPAVVIALYKSNILYINPKEKQIV